jgi:phosphopantothenoylcysteine decarboxylase/phosphopantothenate--cysteine ligase
MNDRRSLFIFASAAGSARQVGALIQGSLDAGWATYVVGTPNLELIAPTEALLDVHGAHWISGYGQPPLDRFPFGTMLVAPCTFNTFNKLAAGLADNLATAMVADALGAGLPVFIAPSMNPGLWAHPRTRESDRLLRSWGCTIIDPQISAARVTMAPVETILAALRGHLPPQ